MNKISKNKVLIFLGLLFLVHVFLRFYFLEQRMGFNWDQVDNAWASARILHDHKFPLLGMVAKANSGFNIGPLYYYYIAIFYFLFQFNPIASPVAAAVTSIFTFFIIFILIKKLFNEKIALIATFIHTVSFFIIQSDRSQWPVDFIVPLSLVIFYCLYNVLLGKVKYIPWLFLFVGLSFHIHFTSIFYPMFILLCLPFFPRKKETLLYGGIGVIAFFALLTPNIIIELQTKNAHTNGLINYINAYYHGFHLTRVLQLTHDAFIEFILILRLSQWQFLSYFLLPLFIILYCYRNFSKKKGILCYLMVLWFLVPWFVFATYSGELTNYYFFITRPIVLIILAYVTYRIWLVRTIIPKILVLAFWSYFAFTNISSFFSVSPSDYLKNKHVLEDDMKRGKQVGYFENTSNSYLYYYFTVLQKQDEKKK